MSRIRTIKPDFWTDEKLTECSLSARLLFIGTWNFADDAGNLDRSPKQIKARVFPIDAIDCEPLLQELIAQGVLIEYSRDGKNFLHIKGFAKHQLINRPSKPSCPEYEESMNTQETLTESSLSPHDGRKEGKEGRELSDCASSDDECTTHDQTGKVYTAAFTAFWEMYPNKKSKGDAAKAFEKIKKAEYAEVKAGLLRAIDSADWKKNNGQFIKHPGAWLRARGWEDEYASNIQPLKADGKLDMDAWMRSKQA